MPLACHLAGKEIERRAVAFQGAQTWEVLKPGCASLLEALWFLASPCSPVPAVESACGAPGLIPALQRASACASTWSCPTCCSSQHVRLHSVAGPHACSYTPHCSMPNFPLAGMGPRLVAWAKHNLPGRVGETSSAGLSKTWAKALPATEVSGQKRSRNSLRSFEGPLHSETITTADYYF